MNWLESNVYLQVSSHYQESNTINVLLKVLETMCCNVKVDTNLPELNEAKQDNLYLICARDTPWNDMLPAHLMLLARDHRVIVYNAKHEEISEQLLLMANVKGVFYHNDTPDILLKGISKILNDELWFKRSSICKAFGNLLAQQPKYAISEQSNDSLEKLTKRERTIIHLISQGAKNKDVAEKLHISDHTVKTHLYSAFRKTNARNRIELVNWAQKFLPCALQHGATASHINP